MPNLSKFADLAKGSSLSQMNLKVVNGGQGKNIACDMAQEICNRVSKDVVRGMGPNVKAMTRASKAAAGIQQIVKRVNSKSDIKRVSQVHSHKSSTEDELLMVKDLI